MEDTKEEIKKIVKKELKELADLKYKEFHSSLCPGISNILGVRVPILRKYAKDFSNRFPNANYKHLDSEFYEEVMLQGMLVGFNVKNDFKINIKEIEWFVPRIDNWAVCDIFVSGLKFIKKAPEKYWEFIKSYTYKSKEFEKRFAYVVMLSYYINDKYIDEVLELLVNEFSQDYYVYMSVAWALSVCLVKYYDKTLDKMKSSNLNKKTYNKAIQKAIESSRITKLQKVHLKSVKKA